MIFTNGKVFVNGHYIDADVAVENGRFVSIISRQDSQTAVKPAGGKDACTADPERKYGEVIDCTGKKLIPGLIDVHTHGCLGYDFSKSSAEEDAKMCRFYATHGVTSILATTMTNEPNQYKYACGQIKQLIAEQAEGIDGDACTDASNGTGIGARVLGINMEGPFISKEKRGAHDPQYIFPVTEEFFKELDDASGNAIRLLTIAPELDGAMEFIEKHAGKQFISIGHSACDYDTACRAADKGADHVTHLFNAMTGFAHRNPGIFAAASDRGLYTELICDGLHVNPAAMRVAFRAIQGKIVLISDSINPTGLPDGEYSAGGLPVFVENGEIRLADGTLAGSSISLYEGMVRTVSFGIPEEEAILSATYNPAVSVGCADRAGVIAEGRNADFVIADGDLTLEAVYIGGKRV